MITVDANFLIALFEGHKHTDGKRENKLHIGAKSILLRAREDKLKIIVPCVSLAEYLVHYENPHLLVQHLMKDKTLIIASFDNKSALEHSILCKSNNNFKSFSKLRTRQGIKFDAQIIAISLAHNATTICSDDKDLLIVAKSCGLEVISFENIETHSSLLQKNLFI